MFTCPPQRRSKYQNKQTDVAAVWWRDAALAWLRSSHEKMTSIRCAVSEQSGVRFIHSDGWLQTEREPVTPVMVSQRVLVSLSSFPIHVFSAGLLAAAAFLVAVAYAGCSHVLTVTFLTLSMTIGGTTASGVYMNQIDIAPRWVSPCRNSDDQPTAACLTCVNTIWFILNLRNVFCL